MSLLDNYAPIVGAQVVDDLRLLASKLKGKRVLHVNSTAVGGGVAEILNRMVPMMNELGIPTRWEVVKGGEEFYTVTKKIHNALHAAPVEFKPHDFEVFLNTQKDNIAQIKMDEPIVFIHEPQPIGLVQRKPKLKNKWIWRCHVDVSDPHPAAWGFLVPFIENYDSSVFSSPRFARHLGIPQALICPSIDPLSEKNRSMSPEEIKEIMGRLKIPLDRPLVTQVSRFDRLKDPVGVVKVFKKIKNTVNARLLLVGGTATDDPEGAEVLAEVQKEAANDSDIIILPLPPASHTEINAIQRASTVILQKSLKEGFGLTITEALWKSKPVIAGAVGGIPLQIKHQYSGILTHSLDDTAYWLKKLLDEPEFAKKLGENGREEVRTNFLLTRHLKDYLLLFLSLYYEGDASHL